MTALGIQTQPELRVWLCQVQCTAAQRRELSDLAEIFHGTICDVSLDTVTLELQVPNCTHEHLSVHLCSEPAISDE